MRRNELIRKDSQLKTAGVTKEKIVMQEAGGTKSKPPFLRRKLRRSKGLERVGICEMYHRPFRRALEVMPDLQGTVSQQMQRKWLIQPFLFWLKNEQGSS